MERELGRRPSIVEQQALRLAARAIRFHCRCGLAALARFSPSAGGEQS